MDRRILKTKDAIKSNYKMLLLENKNSKITITQLAQRANIDRKTFYLHYNSVDDIMKELVEENLSDLEFVLKENGISNDNLDAKIIIDSMNYCLVKDIEFFKAIVHRHDFQIYINEIKKTIISIAIRDFTENTTNSQKEVFIYSKFIISGIVDVYVDWFLHPNNMSLDELGDIISKVLNSGIQVLSYKEL